MTLWEVFSYGRTPHEDDTEEEVRLKLLNDIIKLPKPESCPMEVYYFMLGCVKVELNDRPEFDDIVKQLITSPPPRWHRHADNVHRQRTVH